MQSARGASLDVLSPLHLDPPSDVIVGGSLVKCELGTDIQKAFNIMEETGRDPLNPSTDEE